MPRVPPPFSFLDFDEEERRAVQRAGAMAAAEQGKRYIFTRADARRGGLLSGVARAGKGVKPPCRPLTDEDRRKAVIVKHANRLMRVTANAAFPIGTRVWYRNPAEPRRWRFDSLVVRGYSKDWLFALVSMFTGSSRVRYRVAVAFLTPVSRSV
jgi:hypothetical protein